MQVTVFWNSFHWRRLLPFHFAVAVLFLGYCRCILPFDAFCDTTCHDFQAKAAAVSLRGLSKRERAFLLSLKVSKVKERLSQGAARPF